MSQLENHPPIPLTPEEVTPEWISTILGVKISPKNFRTVNDIQAGSGFLSSMLRLQCQSENESQKFNLIVKLLPRDEKFLALVVSEGFDNTEINFYKQIVPDLLEISPELKNYFCPSYYGHVQQETNGRPYASVLVLEDLKPHNYYTINFAGEESSEQIQEVLEFMAKFHVAGMILEKRRNAKLPQLYNFLQGVSDSPETSLFYEMAKGGFMQVDQILKDNDVSPDVILAYQTLSQHSDKIIKKVEAASKKFSCLIHGDLWSNNLLFNENSALHTKVLDYQLVGYKDPIYDIAATIISSVPKNKLTKKFVDQYVQHYYDTFVSQCKNADCPELINRSREEFSSFFYTWGCSYTMLWFLMDSAPFAANIPRLVKIYEFLIKEVNVLEFLLSQVL